MTTQTLNFICIDDSKLDCFIVEKIIKNLGKCQDVYTFLTGKDGLEYIMNNPPKEGTHTFLVVDIQMPVMNGFKFVEEFEKLDDSITRGYTIWVVGSSINESDLSKVHNFKSIKQFLNKPLTSNNLLALFS